VPQRNSCRLAGFASLTARSDKTLACLSLHAAFSRRNGPLDPAGAGGFAATRPVVLFGSWCRRCASASTCGKRNARQPQLDVQPDPDCACGFRSDQSQPIVLAHAPRVPQTRRMDARLYEPSPGPWTFSEHMHGIAHCLIDRDGRVIGCNLPISNWPLLEQAPAMADLLRAATQASCANTSAGRSTCPARAWRG
jgi:hypothetical protein